jgi:hypothetical protein
VLVAFKSKIILSVSFAIKTSEPPSTSPLTHNNFPSKILITLLEFLMYTLIYNGLKKGVDSYTLTKTTNINDQYKSEIKVDDRSKE